LITKVGDFRSRVGSIEKLQKLSGHAIFAAVVTAEDSGAAGDAELAWQGTFRGVRDWCKQNAAP